MRTARLQTNELGRTDNFFGSLLSKEDIKENEKEKIAVAESPKPPHINGNSVPFRSDSKPRFSDPPAPPPQQPLPEKPDIARSHIGDSPVPSLKRTNTERPRSVPGNSPIRQEATSQILNLVEALEKAKKEIVTQGSRLRDLEEMLQKERQARELAEDNAKRLELQSEAKVDVGAKTSDEGSVIEEAFEPPSEVPVIAENMPAEIVSTKDVIEPVVISDSTSQLEKRLETMLHDMQELRDQMESFKNRAETAETERDNDRKTLAEMVEKIRSEASARRSSSTERASSPSRGLATESLLNGTLQNVASVSSSVEMSKASNGHAITTSSENDLSKTAISTISRPPSDPILYHASPYVSMMGVVLIGMGMMAYLNGWQPPKPER